MKKSQITKMMIATVIVVILLIAVTLFIEGIGSIVKGILDLLLSIFTMPFDFVNDIIKSIDIGGFKDFGKDFFKDGFKDFGKDMFKGGNNFGKGIKDGGKNVGKQFPKWF